MAVSAVLGAGEVASGSSGEVTHAVKDTSAMVC